MPDLKLTDGTRTITLIRRGMVASEAMPIQEPEFHELFVCFHDPRRGDVWLDESDHQWTEVVE